MALFENPDGLAVAREQFSERARRRVYAVATLVGYALYVVAAGVTTAATLLDVPEWLPISIAIGFAVLGAALPPLAQLAGANVGSRPAVAVAPIAVAPQAAVEVAVGDDEPEPAPEVDPDDLIVQRAAFGDGGGDV